MKKIISIFLSILCLCMFSACDFIDEVNQGLNDEINENSIVYFDDFDYSVQFTPGWEKVENDNFNLKCSLNDGEQYALFWVYNDLDISKDSTRNSIYREGIDSVLDIRENVELTFPEITIPDGDKTITATMYSADFDSMRCSYYFCMVELENTDDYFCVIFTSLPSVALENMNSWLVILKSIAPVTKSEQ